jgi:hypothetical protein
MKGGPLGSLCVCAALTLALAAVASGPGQGQEAGKGVIVSIDGLQSRPPGEWIEEKPTINLRYKQFRLPAVGNDKENGEMVIFFFGSGQGGSAEENMKRWKGFFAPPEGKKIDDVAKIEKLKISGVDATYLDVHGTYLARFPPNDPKAKVTRKPNYRMLGVVFESKEGPYFFRLLGPADTVAHYKKGFDDWLKAFK